MGIDIARCCGIQYIFVRNLCVLVLINSIHLITILFVSPVWTRPDLLGEGPIVRQTKLGLSIYALQSVITSSQASKLVQYLLYPTITHTSL